MDETIDVKNLRKSYGDKIAVYDFSLTVKKGEIVGFLGPNGSGKTTVIRMLCGILATDSGSGKCLGYDLITQSNIIRSQVGYMTQRFSLYKYLTIYENLNFIAGAFEVSDKEKKINELMAKLDLAKRKKQTAGSLSGGWQQRLALGAALLHQPKLLLLDEPTAGVDPEERRNFWQIINDIASEGITVLVSTHYMDEAERCHRIVYLAYGKKVAEGSVQDIIRGSHLSTWQVSGDKDNINKLAKELVKLQGVEQVTPFGITLHITSKNKKLLFDSLRPYLNDLQFRWKGVEPNLEDVFINYVFDVKEERFG